MIKIKKKVPLIDQHDKNGFWGEKFGGNFIPETLKKPVDDLEVLFEKLRKDKNFIKERDRYFKNWIGSPTRFIKLEKTDNETNRSLEQMRFIDHNIDIFVGYTDDNPLSIDTKEDLEKIRKIL